MTHPPIGPTEGEALRRLIEKWREFAAKRIGYVVMEGYESPCVTLAKCADELEAALAPLSGPVDASGEPGLDLEPIKARVAAASKGPWVVAGYDREDGERWVVFDGGRGEDSSILQDKDAEFIADAREVIPALIAEISHLRAAAAVPSSPAQEKHEPPAVHHLCGPNVIGVTGPPHASWCWHDRTWVDGAAQQDDYTCSACGTKISTNISEWSQPALPPSSLVADSPTELEQADARILHLEAAIQDVLDAYGDDGWARSEMCRHLRRAIEGSAPSPSAGAAKEHDIKKI